MDNKRVKKLLYLPPELSSEIEKRAKADGRSFTSYVQRLLEDSIKMEPISDALLYNSKYRKLADDFVKLGRELGFNISEDTEDNIKDGD